MLVASLMLSGAALADETTEPTPPAEAETPAPNTPAAPQPPSSDNAATTPEAEKDPMICRRQPPKLGSRVGGDRKMCRKKSEWRALEEKARDSVEGVQSRARTENPPPS
jgi:hypothetical protein